LIEKASYEKEAVTVLRTRPDRFEDKY